MDSKAQALLKKKLSRLETVPDEFLSGIERVEKQYLIAVTKLVSRLKQEGGNLVFDEQVQLQLSEIESQLKGLLLETDYSDLSEEFIKQINEQAGITDKLLKAEFTTPAQNKIITDAGNLTLNQVRKDALYDLMDKPLDAKFISAVKSSITDAVIANSSFTELINTLQTTITGDAQTTGKLMQYSKQIAGDLFAVSDRQYTTSISRKLNSQWFLYSGSIIGTSRPFCVARHNKYYHKLEVEAWADLGEWDGRMPGTTRTTIFDYAGGYGPCRHSILPVSAISVPIDVLKRNIANGNFKPTQFEKDELGL